MNLFVYLFNLHIPYVFSGRDEAIGRRLRLPSQVKRAKRLEIRVIKPRKRVLRKKALFFVKRPLVLHCIFIMLDLA